MARIKANLGGDNTVALKGATNAPATGSLSFRDRLKLKPGQSVHGIERVQIIMDVSGSMENRMQDDRMRIVAAKKAIEFFLDHSQPHQCAIGLTVFGTTTCLGVETLTSPSYVYDDVRHQLTYLTAKGFTPMAEALHSVIRQEIISRAIVVSDGLPDSKDAAFREAEMYIERGFPIDTIYIGTEGDQGHKFMVQLAKMTGGIFAFASDLKAFEKAFGQLETSARIQLMDMRNV